VRVRFRVLTLALLTALIAAAPAAAAENPCAGREAAALLCPNLRIGPPTDLYVQDARGGKLLRATSDVRSRGRGPMELRGTRNGGRTMRTNQRIYRVGGGHIDVHSHATLRFTSVGSYFGGSYWKVHQLARFQLRRATPGGKLGAVVRTGPSSTTACATSNAPAQAGARRTIATTQAATRIPTGTGSPSAPRSAGPTSTRPTTTSSGSTSPACVAASPSR
jgi:hypothetical protein